MVTTTFQAPVAAVDGTATWQAIFVDETITTFVAARSEDPERVSLTVAPFWKPVPARSVIATVDPRVPVFGVIDETAGGGVPTDTRFAFISVSDCPAAFQTVSETV